MFHEWNEYIFDPSKYQVYTEGSLNGLMSWHCFQETSDQHTHVRLSEASALCISGQDSRCQTVPVVAVFSSTTDNSPWQRVHAVCSKGWEGKDIEGMVHTPLVSIVMSLMQLIKIILIINCTTFIYCIIMVQQYVNVYWLSLKTFFVYVNIFKA